MVALAEAVRAAEESGLDLVEVAADAKPPVCRIIDYGKYRYEQSKREKEARKKHRTQELKEIKLRPKIDEHDYQTKLKHLAKFLAKGDKIRVTIMFRGREMAHVDLGRKILDRVVHDLEKVAKVEQGPRQEGRNLVIMLNPR